MIVCVDIEYRYSMRKSSIISWSYTPVTLNVSTSLVNRKSAPQRIIQIFVDLSKLDKHVGSWGGPEWGGTQSGIAENTTTYQNSGEGISWYWRFNPRQDQFLMQTRIIGNRSDITGETNQYYQVDNTRIGLSQIPDTLEDKYLNSQ